LRPTSTACRPSKSECDIVENCDGSTAACTADAVKDDGTACTSDGNSCTDDVCTIGTCAHPTNSLPCSDEIFCNGADTCVNGGCNEHAGDPCGGPDGDADCMESCNEGTDACVAPDPNGSPCSDDDACTRNDSCTNGTCSGQPDPQCATTTTTLPPELCGDANGDGKISAPDAQFALRAAVGTIECSLTVCDYNGDGKLTTPDALLILKAAVGQDVEPRCPPALRAEVTTTLKITTTTVGDLP